MPRVQCEGCEGFVDEADAKMDHYPGTTLAWCPDCAGPSRAQELGMAR